MPELPAPFSARTTASTAFLHETFSRMVLRIEHLNEDAAAACEHAGRIATGGKHLRATLVHVGADRPENTPLNKPDIAVAAAFDLLHAAFLVLDDVIDADETRRGEPTIHAVARALSGDAHYGNSVATLVGTAALNEAIRIVLHCGASAATTLKVLQRFVDATADSMLGEFMDIHHSLPHVHATTHLINLASRLKTSTYSFEAPLACGALLADAPQRIPQFTFLGRKLGSAYQLADDLQSLFGNTETTGKDLAGDIIHNRQTPLISQARNTHLWDKIKQAIDLKDIELVRDLMKESGAVHRTQQEALRNTQAAAQITRSLPLSNEAKHVLHQVGKTIEGSLNV